MSALPKALATLCLSGTHLPPSSGASRLSGVAGPVESRGRRIGVSPLQHSTTNELCIAGGDADVVDIWENLTWQLEIPESVPNTAVALLGVGFTENQVVDLLAL